MSRLFTVTIRDCVLYRVDIASFDATSAKAEAAHLIACNPDWRSDADIAQEGCVSIISVQSPNERNDHA